MPLKKGGTGVNKQGQNYINSINAIQDQTTVGDVRGTMAMSHSPGTKASAGTKAGLNKLQLNDIIKRHLKDLRISDIQLGRTEIFTIYTIDVNSFNCLLNELTPILATNGQATGKIYVPRSIQRIKDTEKVAFVKDVGIEIPESRITEALKDVGLDAVDIVRLTNKVKNMPTTTIKITFIDPQNRNTFVHTGLQVDSMHFIAEPATQNTTPVQCYICLKYNHVVKYCKTKQQICARCGDNHHMDTCTAASDMSKCCNCKDNYLAASNDCSTYIEQEKRLQNLVNQYTTSYKATSIPSLNDLQEFPSLPSISQRQQEHLHSDILDKLVDILSSKMEKIIEETTSRRIKSLQQRIKKIKKTIAAVETIISDNDMNINSMSDSDSNDDIKVLNTKKVKQQQKQSTDTGKHIKNKNKPSSTLITTATQSPAITTDTSIKAQRKTKTTSKAVKRNRSPNSSLDSTTTDNKELKTNINED
ncbi:unnamed protein product [Rotaria sp. Silwood2]|nr:unnamed protein product [Rotaria sp. Silwood2]